MGVLKRIATILAIPIAIWWAISEREYTALVDSARLHYTTDPAFTVDSNDLERAVYCPISVPNAKETVLLVHGTGMTWVNPSENCQRNTNPSAGLNSTGTTH